MTFFQIDQISNIHVELRNYVASHAESLLDESDCSLHFFKATYFC